MWFIKLPNLNGNGQNMAAASLGKHIKVKIFYFTSQPTYKNNL